MITPFKATREPCLLLVRKMEMCILAHRRLRNGPGQPVLPRTLEEIPHFDLLMGFKCLVMFSSWGHRSLRGGGLEDEVILPPSVLQSWVMDGLSTGDRRDVDVEAWRNHVQG